MLELNPGLVFWTIVTFIAVLAILKKVAWKPLIQALVSREEGIRTALDEAETAQKEAQRLLDENRRQLAKAEEESHRIIREGREMGEKLKSEIVEKANASSRVMIEQAKDEIRREKEAALIQLRTEVADLAIGVAGKILDQNLDTPKQRQLADSAIKELQKN
ncbi:MAG: synthase subunit [Bacteroidetes bacterium]|nr:synthase subunit [Bacteroidota bacterium]